MPIGHFKEILSDAFDQRYVVGGIQYCQAFSYISDFISGGLAG